MVRIHRCPHTCEHGCPMQTFLAQIIPMVIEGYRPEIVYENHNSVKNGKGKGYRFFKGEDEYIYFDIQE